MENTTATIAYYVCIVSFFIAAAILVYLVWTKIQDGGTAPTKRAAPRKKAPAKKAVAKKAPAKKAPAKKTAAKKTTAKRTTKR